MKAETTDGVMLLAVAQAPSDSCFFAASFISFLRPRSVIADGGTAPFLIFFTFLDIHLSGEGDPGPKPEVPRSYEVTLSPLAGVDIGGFRGSFASPLPVSLSFSAWPGTFSPTNGRGF